MGLGVVGLSYSDIELRRKRAGLVFNVVMKEPLRTVSGRGGVRGGGGVCHSSFPSGWINDPHTLPVLI